MNKTTHHVLMRKLANTAEKCDIHSAWYQFCKKSTKPMPNVNTYVC